MRHALVPLLEVEIAAAEVEDAASLQLRGLSARVVVQVVPRALVLLGRLLQAWASVSKGRSVVLLMTLVPLLPQRPLSLIPWALRSPATATPSATS